MKLPKIMNFVLIVSTFILLFIVLVLVLYLPSSFVGFDLTDFWAVFGAFLGLGGLILSGFAAYGVSVLARQHHLKVRIPSIHDDLRKLSGKLASASTSDIGSLRSSLITSEIRPLMDALEKLDTAHFKERADSVRSYLKGLEENFQDAKFNIANENDSFWKLHNAISELVDVTKQYQKDMEVS